jgi:hypothetical protein
VCQLDKEKFLRENWGKKPIYDLTGTLNISLRQFLEMAFDLQLYNKNTPNIGRRWTEVEDLFLTNHSNHLSVREASNLLYRSHYATYQRIRVLGLEEMINKK